MILKPTWKASFGPFFKQIRKFTFKAFLILTYKSCTGKINHSYSQEQKSHSDENIFKHALPKFLLQTMSFLQRPLFPHLLPKLSPSFQKDWLSGYIFSKKWLLDNISTNSHCFSSRYIWEKVQTRMGHAVFPLFHCCYYWLELLGPPWPAVSLQKIF